MNPEIGKVTKNRLLAGSRSVLTMMFTAAFFLMFQATCFATNVVLQWDPDTDPGVTGYKVYYQADSSTQPYQGSGATQGPAPINALNQTTATISGLDPNHAYYFAVTAYNASGVESSYSNIVSIPELAPPTTALSYPTNNTTVSGTVSVTASASDNVGVTKVEYYVNGVLKGTDTTTPYVYSWNTSSLASGSYTLMTKAYDAAGNVGQSSNVAVTVVNDTTAPVVSLIAPVNGATVSGTVAITANASDNVGVSKVEFYSNGVLLYASNVSPYSYNWNTTAVANGSYTLTAKAYDNVGNIGQSSNISVTVFNDTAAPTISAFTMPATASSTTVAISSFTATDNASVAGYLITQSATAPAASATGWSATAPTTFTFSAAGSKTAYAWAKDAAGNVSASRSASVNITLSDTTAPTVSVTSPTSGANVGATVSVTTSTSDNIGVTKVEFYVNGTLQATDTAAPYNFSWNTAAITNGSYALTCKAYDAAGNVGQSAAVAVVVNNIVTPPSGSYTAVFGDAAGTNFSGTVEDTYLNINSEVNAKSTFLNTYTWPAKTPANAILMKWNLSSLPANAQIQSATLSLYMTGGGGDALYEMPVSAIINKLPVIANSNGNTYDGVNSWTASSIPYGGIPMAQSDIGPAVDAPLVNMTNGYKSWNVTSLVKDWAMTPGNNKGLLLNSSSKASSDSSRMFASNEAIDISQRPKLVVTYTLASDTVAPVVAISAPANNATVSGTATVTTTASDNVGVGKVEFYINNVLLATATTAPYNFNWNTTAIANGFYTLSCKAYDVAGNVGQSSNVSVTVNNFVHDTTAPTASIISPVNGSKVGSRVIINVSATDNVAVTKLELYIDGVFQSTAAANTLKWTWKTTSYAIGSHLIMVKAFDAANNSSSTSITVIK